MEPLQNLYLRKLVANETPLILFLINGFQIHGTITAFDQYSVNVRTIDDTQQVIFKHSISTVQPNKPVNWETEI